MTPQLQSLIQSLEALHKIKPTKAQTLDTVVTQLDRYCRAALNPDAAEQRGSALTTPLDAVLKISILLLETIDSGTTGLDDQLAQELRKTYEKYLGTFKV